MPQLFQLATNKFILDWHRVRDRDPSVLSLSLPVQGTLKLVRADPSLLFTEETTRHGLLPDALAGDLEHTIGPPLFERTDYKLYLRAIAQNDEVEIRHRDPVLIQGLSPQENGRVSHGVVN
ncbi:MAG: hypothetical protein AAF497_18630, partial [Planctomycetota bacterium]